MRAALESSGLDHGLISVHDKRRTLGMTPVPSIAALARIFRQAGVARTEPRKKPRAAYRRFVYPAPNACWQLDATEYVLAGGRKCVIFQLIDDHSRYAVVASHAAIGETSRDAIRVVRKAIEALGVPQRLLSDNGAALNPSRRGIVGQLVAYVTQLGVEPITGKPYKPTTQGKNERFHQTLFRYLDKQPIAANLRELQAQIDAFDHIYNTQRPHQALPGRITPQAAWDATPKADPPRPKPLPPRTRNDPPPPAPSPNGRVHDGIRVATVHPNGSIKARGVTFNISYPMRGKDVSVIYEAAGLLIFDDHGTLIAEHRWPPPGIKYVGNGRPHGPKKKETSPMS
ncbi:integrase core domain-containing protein [Microbacterium kribbense]|uniref:Integrase core domain-containing protein n=1 Tax=Microbacterium kribbense TaxID=433645 RepID=A0ABP7GUV8_9MICO